MATIIAVSNHKGGVGKSTTTGNLGHALVREGKKVLLVDIDPQSNLSRTFSIDCYAQKHTLHEALLENTPISAVIQSTGIENLDIVPATVKLHMSKLQIMVEVNAANLLANALTNAIRSDYDYILIDCPPELDALTTNALSASDWVIIPMEPEIYALEGIDMLFDTIRKVQTRSNRGLKVMGVLITRVDGRLRLHKDMIEKIRGAALPVFQTEISLNTTLKEAQAARQTVFQYDSRKPGAKDYEALAREVVDIAG